MKPIQEIGSEQKRLTGLILAMKYFLTLLNFEMISFWGTTPGSDRVRGQDGLQREAFR